jgi:predicted CoA-substrate-specific enzyme activase
MRFVGLDVGSVSVKLVVFDEKANRLDSHYKRHKGHPLRVALEMLRKVIESESHEVEESLHHSIASSPDRSSLSITGSAGRLIASILGLKSVNEIVAQACSTQKFFPHIKTIIEMGGEDSKLIILDQSGKTLKDFSMNSICAAGTGSFLDQQAERLRLTIEEFSDLALKSEKPSRIAGRCSVFAKSDMIHLQQIATPVEDIVAGLCFAVARNFKGSISRGRKPAPPVSFHGGVAANKGMARAFKEVFGLDELFVPEEHAFMGAIGAVLKNMHESTAQPFDLSRLEDFLLSERSIEEGHPPLYDAHKPLNNKESTMEINFPLSPDSALAQSQGKDTERDFSLFIHHPPLKTKAFLGIDIGSISTNLALTDEQGRLLAKRYLMTAGRPIEAVKLGLTEIGEEIGYKVEIEGVGTTGSGRYMIADYVGADIVKNEITAHATAAVFFDKTVDTIFEIGGQDSKYISLKDGVVVDFEMNKACAAGTGSFLEEQAEKLSISIKEEFALSALSSKHPSRLGERCTVFMENSLMAKLQKGTRRNDLLAGLAYSIVQNYINRVVVGKHIGENIFFLGGVAFNRAVVSAFERYLDKKISVPLHHEVAGAIGMALIAMRYMNDHNPIGVKRNRLNNSSPITDHASRITSFKGFEISKKTYEISSFECKGCPNTCEINRIKIKDEEGFLFYGGRCDRYDVKSSKKSLDPQSVTHDLFSLRDELLWKEHIQRQSIVNSQQSQSPSPSPAKEKRGGINNLRLSTHSSRLKIGIPYIFVFHDYLPFWTSLFWELGFDIEVSPKTNRQIVNLGLESVLSETCFPVKVAHGHIKYLLDKNIDALVLPSFINLSTPENPFERGYACPYTQTIPYVSKIAFEGIKLLTPIVDLRRGREFLEKEIDRVFKPFGIRSKDLTRALKISERSQEEFFRDITLKGKEAISSIKERTIVIVGRPYNALDSGMNLEIPKKLADLGVPSIPLDFLPIEKIGIHEDWPNMYWRSGQRILQAAKFIRNHPDLYAIYIGNFSCGPDSFILKFFDEEMAGKPYLYLEIDEHSAAAGAITRCEAFIDSIGNRKPETGHKKSEGRSSRPSPVTRHAKRTVFIPRMSDHAFAIAAAFERSGMESEVLPESDKKSADIGRQHVSGKECYPCTVTTGDMVKKVMEPGFESSRSAFFMPSGTGPCRFGQYNVFHRFVLDKLGYEDVPIFAPNQDTTFYSDLGTISKDFTKNAWKGIIAYELLKKCLHETRPYEKDRGTADELYDEYLRSLYFSLKRNNVELEEILKNIRRDFEHLPVCKEKKPLIGIVGEIFVRCHRFSNEDVIRKVEALGGEVWLAPVEEWIYYVNFMGLIKARLKKERTEIFSFLLKRFYQKRVEHKYARHFEGFLKTLHEPDTKEILKKASPYIHSSFEGETILSIGKTIDLLEKGAAGIINAMPFGCMPGTIVTALMRGVIRDHGIPCINIPYDGTESPTTEIQLEAFMDQAKQMKHAGRKI